MSNELIAELIRRLAAQERRIERLESQEALYLPAYDDLPPMPIVTSRLGATAPSLTLFKGTIYQYTFDASDDVVYGATEITHGWQEDTTLYVHIHWATNRLEATAKGVKWRLGYSIGDGNEAFTVAAALFVDTEIPANTTDRTHFVSAFAPTIDGTGFRIGAYLTWALTRVATEHANGEPAADPFALAIGIHALHNAIGSRQLYVK